jgi:toxin ParE1/3/4
VAKPHVLESPDGGKPLVPRALAHVDVIVAAGNCEAPSAAAASVFIDALEAAVAHLRLAPGTGRPRWAIELDLPGMRSRPLARHPHLVFYVEQPARIEIWRVLYFKRDIPGVWHDG